MAEAGMALWAEGSSLRLFPKEWDPHIPEGYEVHSITGKTTAWPPYEGPRDHRFGYLAWGLVPEEGSE